MDALTRVCILFFAAIGGLAADQPQLVWFDPLAPGVWPNGRTGPADYMELFTPSASWTTAASHIQVFDFANSAFDGNLPGALTESQWQQAFADLASRGIALAIQWGPLPNTTCGMGVEGFEGTDALAMAGKIQRLGGDLKYIEMDEPFYYANIYNGTNACNWTAQQIAAQAAQTIAQVRTVFPNVMVGDAEPTPALGVPDWLQKYADWFDAFKAAAGVPLAFFHCDVPWEADPNWIKDVDSIRPALVFRGIPFGIFYNDLSGELPGSTTDANWMQAAESHFLDYEVKGGAIPDQPVFASWTTYPTHDLPETDPNALTYLVDYYFRPRTSLSLIYSGHQASGRLWDSQGNGVAGATISVTMQPTSGAGVVATYTLTGTVPATVSSAVIQICVNQCGSQGTNNMSLYSFQYADSGKHAAFDFSEGLAGWGVDPSGTAAVQPGSDASGPYVSISATSAQSTYINSPSVFAVTPGSAYTLTVTARISPDSTESGYFALIFLTGSCPALCPLTSAFTEVSRATLAYAAGTAALGTAQTGSDGSYSLQFSPLNADGTFQVIAYYAGSDALWPAQAVRLTPRPRRIIRP